jgi:hypothetical protein
VAHSVASVGFAAATGWQPWLLSILGGLAMVPVAILLGVAIAYGVLYLKRVREHEGRRGFLAMLYGVIFGAPSGFYLGFSIAQACLGVESDSVWRRAILSGLVSLLGASIAFIITFISGVHLAEARGVTNYAGERAAWSLFHIALPITFIVSAIVFGLTWWALTNSAI